MNPGLSELSFVRKNRGLVLGKTDRVIYRNNYNNIGHPLGKMILFETGLIGRKSKMVSEDYLYKKSVKSKWW